jgi:hypothetical protein
MSKKHDTASALSGIIRAKRGDDSPATSAVPAVPPAEPEPSPADAPVLEAAPPNPPPALPAAPSRMETAQQETAVERRRGGKSSDPNYSQYSIYLPKAVRKKVGRALDDADTGQDFSELVEELLSKWLTSRT